MVQRMGPKEGAREITNEWSTIPPSLRCDGIMGQQQLSGNGKRSERRGWDQWTKTQGEIRGPCKTNGRVQGVHGMERAAPLGISADQ